MPGSSSSSSGVKKMGNKASSAMKNSAMKSSAMKSSSSSAMKSLSAMKSVGAKITKPLAAADKTSLKTSLCFLKMGELRDICGDRLKIDSKGVKMLLVERIIGYLEDQRVVKVSYDFRQISKRVCLKL